MSSQRKPLETRHTPRGVVLVRGKTVFAIAPDEFATVQASIDKYLFRESAYSEHGFPHGDPRVKGGRDA